jgi:hypothetical protein
MLTLRPMAFPSLLSWRSSRPFIQASLTSTSACLDHHTSPLHHYTQRRVDRHHGNATQGSLFPPCQFHLLTSCTSQEPWYLKLNPNGRIPVLVDRSRNDFIVFETSAILLYLVQHYDKDLRFGFNPIKDADEYSVVLQWLFFSVRGSLYL